MRWFFLNGTGMFSQVTPFIHDFFILPTVLSPPVLWTDKWLQAWKKFFDITGRQDRTPCESSCRISLSCAAWCWARQKATPGVMVHALLVSIQHLPRRHGAFHTSVWFCWKTVIFDLSQRCLSIVCIFTCGGSKPLIFFSFFWRGILTGFLFSISVSFSGMFLLHWEEYAVHVHSLLLMFVLPGKDQFSLTASCHTL